VNSTLFLIPNDNILKKFHSLTKPIMQKIAENMFQISSLSQTRNELLPKLMSWEIRVKDL
jgi:type I restriction enzyme S subunit